MKNKKIVYLIICIALVLLFFGNLLYGAVDIPFRDVCGLLFGGDSFETKASWEHIILKSRLPQTITALFGGAALAVSGLLLQTLFKNPLAGPSILGISDGANLGVAIVMLSFGGYLLTIFSAFLGAVAILAVILFFASKVKNNVMLLIIGIMVGYMTSSVISVLNYYSSADKVQQFVMWGMGDFSAVSVDKLPYFLSFTCFGLLCSMLLIKPLNALLLGENYATNLGLNVKRIRFYILIVTGILTAAVTAFCGPISFIGLAVPHIARLSLGSSNHTNLVPITILSGACVALLCNILTVVPGTDLMMPLNAVTPLIGAPIIIYVIVNRKNIQYFN